MNILRNLFLTATLGLCVSFITSAYDANALTYETTSILNFAQSLRQQNSRKALNVAQWLEKKVMDTSYRVSDAEIIIIAKTVTNNVLKPEAKLTIFAEEMNKEIRNNRYQKFKNGVDTILAGTILTGFGALMVWGFVESIKNPAPIIYSVQKPRPGITITWRNYPYWYWPYTQTTYGW